MFLLAVCCAVSFDWSGLWFRLTITPGTNEIVAIDRIFVDLTEWTLNKNPDMFFCKFYDFITLILTNNCSQKTHAGEREEKAPVRQVFPVSFVSFHIIFPFFLCVSALLHSSSILFLCNFSVSCLRSFPPYLIFPVCPSPFCFEEHHSSTSVFVPAGLVQAQLSGETPRHCLDVCYCSASPQIALVRPWDFCQGSPVPLSPQGPVQHPISQGNTRFNVFCFSSNSWERSLSF